MAIEWSEENLSRLGRVFLRKVLDHMRNRDESIVRFGETGQGLQPNYQVTLPNGVVITLRGSSHEKFEQADQFNAAKISQPFNRPIIQRAYEQA